MLSAAHTFEDESSTRIVNSAIANQRSLTAEELLSETGSPLHADLPPCDEERGGCYDSGRENGKAWAASVLS